MGRERETQRQRERKRKRKRERERERDGEQERTRIENSIARQYANRHAHFGRPHRAQRPNGSGSKYPHPPCAPAAAAVPPGWKRKGVHSFRGTLAARAMLDTSEPNKTQIGKWRPDRARTVRGDRRGGGGPRRSAGVPVRPAARRRPGSTSGVESAPAGVARGPGGTGPGRGSTPGLGGSATRQAVTRTMPVHSPDPPPPMGNRAA